jgi:hypothetical protein
MIGSEGVPVLLAGANADSRFDVGDEDLAVADLAGAGGRDDRVDHFVDELGVDRDLDFSFGRKLTAYSAPR